MQKEDKRKAVLQRYWALFSGRPKTHSEEEDGAEEEQAVVEGTEGTEAEQQQQDSTPGEQDSTPGEEGEAGGEEVGVEAEAVSQEVEQVDDEVQPMPPDFRGPVEFEAWLEMGPLGNCDSEFIAEISKGPKPQPEQLKRQKPGGRAQQRREKRQRLDSKHAADVQSDLSGMTSGRSSPALSAGLTDPTLGALQLQQQADGRLEWSLARVKSLEKLLALQKEYEPGAAAETAAELMQLLKQKDKN